MADKKEDQNMTEENKVEDAKADAAAPAAEPKKGAKPKAAAKKADDKDKEVEVVVKKPKLKGLESLKEVQEETASDAKPAKKPASDDEGTDSAPAPRKPRIDKLGRAYATGKRKDAIARVWLKPGNGQIIVNDKPMNAYFGRLMLQAIVKKPFEVIDRKDNFDVMATVKGGGLSGQADAVKFGISKALVEHDPQFRPLLKKVGFMTRDDRVVERKKYGRHKARKAVQFSKR